MRMILAIAFLLAGLGFAAVLLQQDRNESIDPSLKKTFEVAGNIPKAADRLLSRVVPAGELDEKEFGEAIKARLRSYYGYYDQASDKAIYLKKLLDYLKPFQKKGFEYEVFLIKADYLNAFAMPGGVIAVTEGLVDKLPAEAALLGIMAHELAHVELGHCFERIRFQLLAKKLNSQTLGQLADFVIAGMVRPSFSKTQEAESDDYAFQLMKESEYDPYGVASGFNTLLKEYGARGSRADVLDDYFSSHPSLEQRSKEFSSKAELFWRSSDLQVRRYRGQQNIKTLTPMAENQYDGEWLHSFAPELY